MKFCWGAGDSNSHQKNIVVDLEGMVVPTYKVVPRASCKMLSLAWERQWDALLRRCEVFSSEAFCKTEFTGRTALHLSTFTSSHEGCPIEVARAILKANRHAILVADGQSYTPLHNISLFHGGDELMSLFCDTALMVEQELKGRGDLPTPSRTSPLYLAAKRNAPFSTLRILLQTRARRSDWIAPFTGGEPYWDPQQTLDICSSPLEILLRGRTASFVGISQQTKQQMKAMVSDLMMNHNNNQKNGKMIMLEQQQQEKIIAFDTHDEKAISLWAKCLLLLQENVRTITIHSSGDDPLHNNSTTTVSLVHTVASLRVPMPFLLQLAMELFPEQVTQRDDTGKYPLYHILKANHKYATRQLLTILLFLDNNNNNNKHNKPPYPLPYIQECLQMALRIGMRWQDGLKDIVMANSEVLTIADAQTTLVPAFLAASQDAIVDTIFYLLREEPQVVLLSSASCPTS